MTQAELIAAIKERLDLHLDRDHASVGVKVPFLVINCSQPDNFVADNRVFVEKDDITLTLYCFEISQELEAPIKALFYDLGIAWTRQETYINDEKVWEVEYYFQLM